MAQETDLSVVADIADHFISSEIELLRLKAAMIADSLSDIAEAAWPGVLAYQEAQNPEFIGMAVLDDRRGLVSSTGELPASAEIMNDTYVRRSFSGETLFSSSYHSSLGVVFYLAAPLTGRSAGDRILVLTVPGMYFSDRFNQFVIWQTGHIFMVDAEGNMIANMREAWVQTRINFFSMAETDRAFEPVSLVLRRVVNGETGVGYFPMAGVPRLCSFRPVSASVEGWGMGIIAPLPESPFRDINRGLIVVGFVAFALSILVAAISSRFIKKPFEEVAALKEEAEATSRYKSIFLANMSHEMRTPMNAIIGMTSIGRSSPDISKKDYSFEKIENASTHLLGVINDVLDISKIEANKFELSLTTFNFENVFQKAVNVINFRIDEKQQEFSVYIDKKIPAFLVGDDQRLTQVVANLLSNAVKFTPDKGSIRLYAKHIGEKNGVHTIQGEVSDTGIGISQEQMQSLFDAFQQAESGTSRKFGGTGLGLSISKRILELMGGQIWVESELDKGSTFRFTFQAGIGSGTDESILAPGVNLQNVRVIVIDDNPDVLLYFGELMQQHGIQCDAAPGGKEALAMIKSKGFYDLYFVDWKMPLMDGIELSRKIKEMSSSDASDHKSVVIMISAAQWDLIEKDAKAAGVDKFLPKPLFPSSIIDAINECLGGKSKKSAQKEPQQKEIKNFGAYTMLLVEDIDINREIAETLLEPTGLRIECAENGKEALEKFTAEPDKYNMIFMDIQMPEMDGYEATRQIRAFEAERGKNMPSAERLHGVPIIAMTANVFKEDIEKCLDAGMNDHLGKPLDMDTVMEKLSRYLQR
ncbi:MAG: response regulator [Treponema sp.]|nr:response regulator [Treponema sp.]